MLDLVGYRQTQSYTCGYVAGLMVLHTFKPRASATRFHVRCNPDPEWGMSTNRVARALQQSGVGARSRTDLSFAKIAKALDGGFPIIATVKRSSGRDLHWIVLYGYGRSPNRVLIAGDGWPYLTRNSVLWAEFSRVWCPRGNGIVCWGLAGKRKRRS